MRKKYRLRKSRDFSAVYSSGRSVAGKYLVVYAKSSDRPVVRIGVAAGKKLGNAVVRNRIKRIIREAARHDLPELTKGWDLILIGRIGAKQAKTYDVGRELTHLLKRLKLVSANSE